MTRNLKALGLALMAAFAFSAVVVSGASAQEAPGHITSESTEVTLTGVQTGGEGANSRTAFGSTVECPGTTYTGHKVDVTDPKEPLHSGETEITITPHYVNCSSPVDMNGCDYVLRDFTTDGGNGTYDATFDIVCPEGNSITIGSGFCDTTVPPQTAIGLHMTNTAGGSEQTPKSYIDLTGTLNLQMTNHCLGSTTAVEHFDVAIKGHDEVGNETSVLISDAEA